MRNSNFTSWVVVSVYEVSVRHLEFTVGAILCIDENLPPMEETEPIPETFEPNDLGNNENDTFNECVNEVSNGEESLNDNAALSQRSSLTFYALRVPEP